MSAAIAPSHARPATPVDAAGFHLDHRGDHHRGGHLRVQPQDRRLRAQCLVADGRLGLGGLLSLVGALCYAELATAYPQEGGDYVYLTRGLGRKVGFLFAWAQFWIVRPG